MSWIKQFVRWLLPKRYRKSAEKYRENVLTQDDKREDNSNPRCVEAHDSDSDIVIEYESNLHVLSEPEDMKQQTVASAVRHTKENNKPNDDLYSDWKKLVCDVVSFSEELMEMDDVNNANVHHVVQYALDRIDKVLKCNGVTAIDGEEVFDLLRHVSVEPRPVEDGSCIGKTVRCGWELDGKVLRRAQVSAAVMGHGKGEAGGML